MPNLSRIENILDKYSRILVRQDLLKIKFNEKDFFHLLYKVDQPDSLQVLRKGFPLDIRTFFKAQPGVGSWKLEMPMLLSVLKKETTIRLFNCEKWHPAFAQLKIKLESKLNCRISLNMYYSAAQSQALLPHTDDYAILVSQLDGEKYWKFEGDRKTQVLKKGQNLFFTPECQHTVKSRNTSSLHLSVGFHPLTPKDILSQALRYPNSKPLLQPLKLKSQDFSQQLKHSIKNLMDAYGLKDLD